MTPTDELRRMLDERGVEWRGGLPTETIVREPIDALYVERSDGRMHVYFRSYLTPEQAVEATLERGECKWSYEQTDDGDEYDHKWVTSCGWEWDAEGSDELQANGRSYCPHCGGRIVEEEDA